MNNMHYKLADKLCRREFNCWQCQAPKVATGTRRSEEQLIMEVNHKKILTKKSLNSVCGPKNKKTLVFGQEMLNYRRDPSPLMENPFIFFPFLLTLEF